MSGNEIVSPLAARCRHGSTTHASAEAPAHYPRKASADMVTSILQAIGLFLVTNIDDIIVLSLFFARGAGTRGNTVAIATGQYLGFGAILAA
ncbi:hypothetical protein AB0J48_36165, partial [Nocardia salmonicida]